MSLDHLNTIYRSYDIRGKFPEEITAEEVEKIGKAIVKHFGLKKVAVGRDIRPSADTLFDAISKGITSQGADVVDLGLTTTPMTYFIAGSTDVDATVMITASHMPSQYNGLKITTENAKPVDTEMLQTIRNIVGTHTFSAEETVGSITTHSMQENWINSFKAKHDLGDSQFTLVIDPANMIGALDVGTFKAFDKNLTVHTIYEDFNHDCPNHEANPMDHETLCDLQAEVLDKKADLGIAFDGDADRVGVVDETGKIIPSDIVGAILAKEVLAKYPKTTVVYDLRSTRALPEIVESLGGKAVTGRVGHTFIKNTMREHDATLGIELSGHFFLRDNYFSEGGPAAVFLLLEHMKRTGKKLSILAKEVQSYFHSTEINSTIDRTIDQVYASLKEAFPEAGYEEFDGISLSSDDWWCNVRPSANDPVMRLNLEAKTKELMEEKRDAVLEIIRS